MSAACDICWGDLGVDDVLACAACVRDPSPVVPGEVEQRALAAIGDAVNHAYKEGMRAGMAFERELQSLRKAKP